MTENLASFQDLIDKADQAYYYGDQPLLTDQQYDSLKQKLKELAPKDERLLRLGAIVPSDGMLKKFKHTCPMGSLNKSDDFSELQKWHKSAEEDSLIVALKLDGASLALYYANGKLVRAVTRGGDDGFGEDITANAKKFDNIKHKIPDYFSGVIRGECILLTERWKEIDPKEHSNPRNMGNGIMRRLDGKHSELLSFYAFDIHPHKTPSFHTELNKLQYLNELGFPVTPYRHFDTLKEAQEFYEATQKGRDILPFWIDGVVFKANSLNIQTRLGVKDNRPKGQTVLKFEAESAETTILDIILTVGHTGAIIPTARVEPVRLGGTTVSNALLNNFDYIKSLGVAIGCRVLISKMKDIIPAITKVIDPIYYCPKCNFRGTFSEQQMRHQAI